MLEPVVSPVEQTAQILEKAKEDVMTALQPHAGEMVSITVISGLTRLINQLNFMLNRSPTVTVAAEFPPVTNFFGDPIKRAAEIVPADLKPTLTEKEIYQQKVDALQLTFRERQPETLISDFSRPQDALILRGVAKRAGLEDYADGIINIDFVERIKAGLDAIYERAKEEDEINQKLAADPTTTDPLSTTRTVKQALTTRPNSNS